MGLIAALFSATLGLFQLNFSVFGFSMNFWQILIWSAVVGILIEVIRRFFFDD